jgi:hypothetical protein
MIIPKKTMSGKKEMGFKCGPLPRRLPASALTKEIGYVIVRARLGMLARQTARAGVPVRKGRLSWQAFFARVRSSNRVFDP